MLLHLWLLLHISVVIPLFASHRALSWPWWECLRRGFSGHPQHQQKGCQQKYRVTAAFLLFRLGWHISRGKLDFRCFPHFSSFSENKPSVVKAVLSWCHLGRSCENNMLMELLRFSNSLAGACNWEWTWQDRQQGRHMEQLDMKKARISIEVRRGQGLQAGSKGVATNPYQWCNEIICPYVGGSHR